MALEERKALRGLRLHDQTKRGDKGNVIIIVDKASYHAILFQVHTKQTTKCTRFAMSNLKVGLLNKKNNIQIETIPPTEPQGNPKKKYRPEDILSSKKQQRQK